MKALLPIACLIGIFALGCNSETEAADAAEVTATREGTAAGTVMAEPMISAEESNAHVGGRL